MGVVVRPHTYPGGVVARPEHVTANEVILYNLVNGNLDWENIKAALQNAANGLVKLDANAKVPVAQMPELIPSGVIVMWSGLLSAIPSGWSLCDGDGATPDLRDKFIRGAADGVDPGGTGGSDSITLVEANLPSHTHGSGGAHTHSATTSSAGAHTHTTVERWCGGGSIYYYCNNTTDNRGNQETQATSSAGAHTHTASIASAGAHTHAAVGSGVAFDNKPAYFALAFIMKD